MLKVLDEGERSLLSCLLEMRVNVVKHVCRRGRLVVQVHYLCSSTMGAQHLPTLSCFKS